MKTVNLLLLSLSILLGGCEKKSPEYHLTAEQRTWQPYHVGDELRFGRAGSSKVRTFRITSVENEMDKVNNCGGIPLWGCPPSSLLERMSVEVQRTDTVRYYLTTPSTPTEPDSLPYTGSTELVELRMNDYHGDGPATLEMALAWDAGFRYYLQLQNVLDGGAPADSAVQLLPTSTLGGITYGPTIRITIDLNQPYYGISWLRATRIRRLYYAKGVGVVGYEEVNGPLWYRLH